MEPQYLSRLYQLPYSLKLLSQKEIAVQMHNGYPNIHSIENEKYPEIPSLPFFHKSEKIKKNLDV